MEKSSRMNLRLDPCILPVLFLAFSATSATARAETEFSGHIKSYALLYDASPGLPGGWLSQSSVRLMLDVFEGNRAWQLHYEAAPVIFDEEVRQSGGIFSAAGNRETWRTRDLGETLHESSQLLVLQNLDRFNLQLRMQQGDLTLGRQAITFGAARIINPSDIFLPFDLRLLNTEYRVGVDAVRFQRQLGELGELDLGWIFAESNSDAVYLQGRGNFGSSDISGILMHFAGQTLAGAGLERALGNFGFWFEAAHSSGDSDYLRLSTGLDHAFSETVFGLVEYHYNGAGKDAPADYPETAGEVPYQAGGVFLLGEHYLLASVSAQPGPLVTLSLQAIANLSDRSSLLHFSSSWSLGDDLFLDAGLQLYNGRRFSRESEVLRSEYGDAPDQLYLSFRYYF